MKIVQPQEVFLALGWCKMFPGYHSCSRRVFTSIALKVDRFPEITVFAGVVSCSRLEKVAAISENRLIRSRRRFGAIINRMKCNQVVQTENSNGGINKSSYRKLGASSIKLLCSSCIRSQLRMHNISSYFAKLQATYMYIHIKNINIVFILNKRTLPITTCR